MIQSRLLGVSFVAFALMIASGCSKDAPGGGDGEKGCGSDYADPMKLFCVKLPKGYTAKPDADTPNELYAELMHFRGEASGFDITVGFSNSNNKTYADELAYNERIMKISGRKVDSSGATTTGDGKWWLVTFDGGMKSITSVAKSNGDKSIGCTLNGDLKPEVIEACKSIRAYPGGAAPPAFTAKSAKSPSPAKAAPPPPAKKK